MANAPSRVHPIQDGKLIFNAVNPTMDELNRLNFTREEVRKRMMRHASAGWQMRIKDIEAADPLVTHLMDACAFEFENTAQTIDDTRQRIMDRLASVLCPEVIDLPRPAHAVLHTRPEDPVLELPQQAQFYHRRLGRTTDEKIEDLFFSPIATSYVVNGDIRYTLSEQGLFRYNGRDRVLLERQLRPVSFTDYQSVWLGIELHTDVPSLSNLSIFFDWENEPERAKAVYCRKLQDATQNRWLLNGTPLMVYPGFQPNNTPDNPLADELDPSAQLEKEVRNLYDNHFITLGVMPDRDAWNYNPRKHPTEFLFTDAQQQRYFQDDLIWLELRLSRDFPVSALAKMDVRMNCVPVMNRRLNKKLMRLFQALNVFSLKSEEDFLAIRRVYDAETKDLYRSSPLRNPDDLTEDQFMWRPHNVGRFDGRSAREILYYVRQMLLEESQAFAALGSGMMTQTIETLNRSVEDLHQRMQEHVGEGFTVGHPYIFIKPRQVNTNIFMEYWSTNGKAANNLPAGTPLKVYEGSYFMRKEAEDLFLVTATAGGREKPTVATKEQQLRQNLLTRQRLVTEQDIKAECEAYFFERTEGVPVAVSVTKGFALGLIEGAGYVRCLDVLIRPKARTDLTPVDWEAECERLRQHLADRSAMNLPYRVRYSSTPI